MADKEHYTLGQILAAIKGSSGIKATIQRRLGCNSRSTVDNYLKRYATAQQAYDDEVETVGDVAESVIFRAIKNEDVETAKWYAKAKLKSRGYVERQEPERLGEITIRVKYGDEGTDSTSTRSPSETA